MNRKSITATLILLVCAFSSFAATPPTTGFVTVPGGMLFFEERGRGPAVVLIHGAMLDHRMWDPQVEALARHFRVIRYDVASHGQSPAIEGDWKGVDHLATLLDDRKVDRATLIGLSLGGRIAIDFAIAHPERVRSLVLVDPVMSGFPFSGRDRPARLGDLYRAQLAGDAARHVDLFLRNWLAGEALLAACDRQGAAAAYSRALEIDQANANARAALQKIEQMPEETTAAALPERPADDRTTVEKTIRDAIGWALTKDRTRLESIMAHDADFFIFHPDSKSTVRGYESFAKMIPGFMDPSFKATHFDVKELTPVFSHSGDVAWFSAMLEDCGTWMGKESCWKETRWTGVLERRDGRWLIVQMHFSFAKDKVLAEAATRG